MRSKLLKVVLGCGFAAALVAPALACDFHAISTESEQATAELQQVTPVSPQTAQSQQTTADAPQTAQSQPAADTGSN